MSRSARQKLEQVAYQPPGGYQLDLEVMPISELIRRGSVEHFSLPQRVAFHLIIGVTAGHCSHMIDFVSHDCSAGTWLMLDQAKSSATIFRRNGRAG